MLLGKRFLREESSKRKVFKAKSLQSGKSSKRKEFKGKTILRANFSKRKGLQREKFSKERFRFQWKVSDTGAVKGVVKGVGRGVVKGVVKGAAKGVAQGVAQGKVWREKKSKRKLYRGKENQSPMLASARIPIQ